MTDKQRFTKMEEYISTFPEEIQSVFEQVRQMTSPIHKRAARTARISGQENGATLLLRS